MERLLIPAIVVAVFILLIIIFRIRLMLFYSRRVHGKYSNKFISRFKSLTKTNPYPYCLKTELFQHLCLFRDRKAGAESHTLDGEINPPGMRFGLTFKEFLNAGEEPDCYNIVFLDKQEVNIAGKSGSHFGEEALLRYYFMANRLFKVDLLYRNVRKQDIIKISSEFRRSLGLPDSHSAGTLYVEYDNCSIYFGDDGFSLMIKYLEKNNSFIESVLKY
ncbi:MAG: hypothetical protein JXA03_04285 [Bacteroidales bacterium]|nr:hypothetical protein [Bacteroidales bacterium]